MQEWSPVTENDDEQLVSFGRFAPRGSYAAHFEPVTRKWKSNQRCLQYVTRIEARGAQKNRGNLYSTLLEIIVSYEAKQTSENFFNNVKEISLMDYSFLGIFTLLPFHFSFSLNMIRISSGIHHTKCNQKKEECVFLRAYKMFVILRCS